MTSADIPLGMTLSQQAGWNQTRADWRRFLALEPGGCFVGELDGRPKNTNAVIAPYVDLLLEVRMAMRAAKQWEQADLIRDRLHEIGIAVEDDQKGSSWRHL